MHAIQRITSLRIGLAAGIVLALGGCAVGPDYHRPPAPADQAYAPAAMPTTTASAPGPGGSAQRIVAGMDIPGQWWTLFHSEPLNALIDEALKHNPNLDAAQAALQEAWQNVYAQRGLYFPGLSANVDPTRQKIAGTLASPASSGATFYSLTTAQVSVSYTPDLWGANRRQVESLIAQADAQRFQLEATYLTLTSNLVNAAVTEASLREQIAATKSIVDSQSKILDVYRKQLALGDVPESGVAAQETVLEQSRASLPPLRSQLAQQRDLLAALSGRTPGQGVSARFDMDALHLPDTLPLSLPARLVDQRPDVRAAEAQLHAACAQVGVAFANRLPNMQISANIGSSAVQVQNLFGHGTGFWNVGASITQPLFDGGTLRHRQRAAEAAWRQAQAQYRSTVLSALQNVADALHAVHADAQTLTATSLAEQAAARSLAIAQRQQALGDIGTVALLNAQIAYRQAELAMIQARASRYADTAALFQALGGGWWNRHDVEASHGVPAQSLPQGREEAKE